VLAYQKVSSAEVKGCEHEDASLDAWPYEIRCDNKWSNYGQSRW